jgi:hypothetical protein
MEAHVIPTQPQHCLLMAPHLRKADADEMWLQAGWRPIDALKYCFEASKESYSVMLSDSDVPVIMYGICDKATPFSNKQVIWLLATDRLKEVKKRFLREGFNHLLLLAAGSRVYNYVSADNVTSLRWLKFLGFNILPAKPHGWLNKPFHYVEMVIPCASLPQPPRPS